MNSAMKIQREDAAALAVDQHRDFVFASGQGRMAQAAPPPAEDVEHIRDFAIATDQLDLSDVALGLGLSAHDTQAALQCVPNAAGTLLTITVQGVVQPLIVIHNVTPAALQAAAPWTFEDLGPVRSNTVPANVDAPVAPVTDVADEPVAKLPVFVLDSSLALDTAEPVVSEPSAAHIPTDAADAFIFECGPAMAPPVRPTKAGQKMEIAQLAEALGVSEMQVLDAIRIKGTAACSEEGVQPSDVENFDLTPGDTLGL